MRSLGGLEFFILLHRQESTELYSKMLWYYVQRYDEILFIKTSFNHLQQTNRTLCYWLKEL